MSGEGERLARMEEQLRWMAPRVERIEAMMLQALEFKWRVYGGIAVIASGTTLGITLLARGIMSAFAH